jgi:hypothetical protein
MTFIANVVFNFTVTLRRMRVRERTVNVRIIFIELILHKEVNR